MNVYIDGFLLPLPSASLAAYRATAGLAGEVWMSHGALAYWECLADDLDVEGVRSFRVAADCTADETVVFSWIVFASRADRDRINAAVLADPRMQPLMQVEAMPFDCGRMAYGGFTPLVVMEQGNLNRI
ncbi:DUF1428 domain-containing protein [Chitinilyticum litopenaei]|uniref:DUF1428 domain-containing protein n=1 Tax=Chitinilyticum litopenaei TaxID=1121276 RepID=UPI00048CBCD6|nr:DUF1428 domain-containing protein [Chitinilyticum litopenaei]